MRIVIAGAGEVGSHLAKMLRNASHDVIIIDNDNERLQRVTSMTDVGAVFGSPTSIEVQRSAEVSGANLFIAVYPRAMQHINIVSALIAKKLGAEKVVARVNDEGYLAPENKLMFKEMGVDLMFYPERVAADEIVESLRHTSTSESMDFAHGKLQIVVFRIDEDSPMMDVKVSELAEVMKQEQVDFRVIAINRNTDTLIPRFDTKFQYHDLAFIVTKRDGVGVLMQHFGLNSLNVDKVMIAGGGVISEMLAKSLVHQISGIKILEINKERCFQLAESLGDKVQIVNGDGRNSDFLLDENIKDYDAFVALTGLDELNVIMSLYASSQKVPIVVMKQGHMDELQDIIGELSLGSVISPKQLCSDMVIRYVRSMRDNSGDTAVTVQTVFASNTSTA